MISDLAVFGFDEAGKLEVISLHPGIEAATVQEACGFELAITSATVTRLPSAEEMALIEAIDPSGRRYQDVPA